MTQQAGLKKWTLNVRVIFYFLHLIPLAHLGLFIAAAICLPNGWRLAGSLFVLLLPPLTARAIFYLHTVTEGVHPAPSRTFLVWVSISQMQMMFFRLPFIEKMLLFIPGLYSAWLRLWGSRVGRSVYWPADIIVLDRSFLDIGDNALLGDGVKLCSHYIDVDEYGDCRLTIGIIRIGARSIIGGYSVLAPGSVVPAGKMVRAFSLLLPFSEWIEDKNTVTAVPQ